MHKHHYWLVTENGDQVMAIRSAFTNLDFRDYAQKFIVPMLPALSEAEGQRVYFTEGDTGGFPQ